MNTIEIPIRVPQPNIQHPSTTPIVLSAELKREGGR